LQLFPVLVMLVMVTCAVYQILTLVFKVAILSIVVACYLGVSIYQSLNESNVEPTGRWLAGVLVLFFMACLVAHSQHTEATYRSSVPFRTFLETCSGSRICRARSRRLSILEK